MPVVLLLALAAVPLALWPLASRRVGPARDRGASALEFAIIAAIVVVAASVVGGVIYNIVRTKSDKLNTCANQAIGSAACAP